MNYLSFIKQCIPHFRSDFDLDHQNVYISNYTAIETNEGKNRRMCNERGRFFRIESVNEAVSPHLEMCLTKQIGHGAGGYISIVELFDYKEAITTSTIIKVITEQNSERVLNEILITSLIHCFFDNFTPHILLLLQIYTYQTSLQTSLQSPTPTLQYGLVMNRLEFTIYQALKYGMLKNETFCNLTMANICRMLIELHQFKFMHRDFRGPNVMINSEGDPNIIDFGYSCMVFNDSFIDAYPGRTTYIIRRVRRFQRFFPSFDLKFFAGDLLCYANFITNTEHKSLLHPNFRLLLSYITDGLGLSELVIPLADTKNGNWQFPVLNAILEYEARHPNDLTGTPQDVLNKMQIGVNNLPPLQDPLFTHFAVELEEPVIDTAIHPDEYPATAINPDEYPATAINPDA
jgi:Protein kinase domain.